MIYVIQALSIMYCNMSKNLLIMEQVQYLALQ